VVKVGAVYHILNEAAFLVIGKPLALLFHYLVERVGKVSVSTSNLNLLVQSGVQLHYWVFIMLGQVFQQTSCSNIVPVLWILLQEPSVIILIIHVWVLNQI